MKLISKRILLLLCGICILAIPLSILYAIGGGGGSTGADPQAELQAALETGLPVLVAFYSPGCSHCKEDKPVLDQLAADYEGLLVIVRVDVSTQFGKALAQKVGIRGVPAYFLLDPIAEDVLYSHVGRLPVDELIAALP